VQLSGSQLSLWDQTSAEAASDSDAYLTTQLVTYIGNKRQLLSFIGRAVETVRERLGSRPLRIWDAFTGSGVVARYFRRFARSVAASDLEPYCEVISRCYLANRSAVDLSALRAIYKDVTSALNTGPMVEGFITELYSPKDDQQIRPHERVFYTRRNAIYLDTARQLIERIDPAIRHFFLAPLLSEASIHANTAGVFKGFYKDHRSGVGQFGGANRDALTRILGEIRLPFPVFSSFECESRVFTGDATSVAAGLGDLDLAYFDPPYNQHPYGSNYFMLNLLLNYSRPTDISKVSGIPVGWNRSPYNKRHQALAAFTRLLEQTPAKFVLVSFNSEGFITQDQMLDLLSTHGKVQQYETRYNTFRGSRNLNGRDIHVKEFLYLLEKR
jgi:adenine-specific DNA-methyltransferase